MKFKKLDIVVIIGITIGIFLMSYPSLSNWWNSKHQSIAIGGYIEKVEEASDQEKINLLEEAEKYNNSLIPKGLERFTLDDNEKKEYFKLLQLKNEEIISIVEIPKFNIRMPVYHGTDKAVLQIGAGHIPGSSLPVGGKGTHTVISAHTGLPSARLFTDIEKMKSGDIFIIYTLGNTMTYKVNHKSVVLPTELDELDIKPDKDYVTLQTCTPYGVNTHRLLVRGTRINNIADDIEIIADIVEKNKYIINAMFIVILSIIVYFLKRTYVFLKNYVTKVI